MTVAALAAAGGASVLVPFPLAGDDHQTANAKHLSEHGAAILLSQNEASVEALLTAIERFIADPSLARRMGDAARERAMPDATQRVVECCLEVALG